MLSYQTAGVPARNIVRFLGVFCLVGAFLLGCSGQPEPTLVPPIAATKTPKPTFTPVPTATLVVPTNTNLPILPTLTRAPPTFTPIPPTATPDASINPLTGERVTDPALLKRRVLAVRIGNDPSIRPLEGLGLADIVIEEVMEGWTITRFTALYLSQNVERIRPIRSARLSSLAIVPQYDAALVHSGASDPIRLLISQASFVDLDQYFQPEPYSILEGYDWRGRMYTSVERIHEHLRQKGWERDEQIEGYHFDETVPQGSPALSIHIPYPKVSVVDWVYSADSASYLRSVEGVPHLEGLTQEQIGAENVIVLYAEHKKTDIVEDSLGSTAIDIVLSGSGRAEIYRDGQRVTAKWLREAEDRPIQYYDDQGRPIPLKPGQTWIELVPTDYEVVTK